MMIKQAWEGLHQKQLEGLLEEIEGLKKIMRTTPPYKIEFKQAALKYKQLTQDLIQLKQKVDTK